MFVSKNILLFKNVLSEDVQVVDVYMFTVVKDWYHAVLKKMTLTLMVTCTKVK